jgi:hypothetical protein
MTTRVGFVTTAAPSSPPPSTSPYISVRELPPFEHRHRVIGRENVQQVGDIKIQRFVLPPGDTESATGPRDPPRRDLPHTPARLELRFTVGLLNAVHALARPPARRRKRSRTSYPRRAVHLKEPVGTDRFTSFGAST